MKINIFAVLGTIGFVFLLGTAGASDLGTITVRQLATRMVVGMLCIIIAVLGERSEGMHGRSTR